MIRCSSSPAFAGEGDRTKCGGGALLRHRTPPPASPVPLPTKSWGGEMAEPVLVTRGLKRSFVQGDVTIEVLRGVDLEVAPGEIVALLGPSGSGKSTLLQAVGLLEGGFEGSIRLNGEEAAELDDEGRTRLRRELLGFVYQFHHLLPEFNAAENVILPQLVRGVEPGAAESRAQQLLGALGLSQRLEHRPSKLSGGEQQRVAVARALANRP